MNCIAPMIALAGNAGEAWNVRGEGVCMSISHQTTSSESPTTLRSQLLADDPELRDIVQEFVSGLETRLAEMRAAYSKLDFDALRTLAHRLKGAGGSYGYPEFSRIAGEMEEQFKQFQATRFEQEIETLTRLVRAAQAGLAS